MNLIKKLMFGSLLGGTILLANPAKSALTSPDFYNVKEVKSEIYGPLKKELYPVIIQDFDEDKIIDQVDIYNMNGKGNWISLRNKFNSKKFKHHINYFLNSFDIYLCSQKGCEKNLIGTQNVNRYQKIFKRKRHFLW